MIALIFSIKAQECFAPFVPVLLGDMQSLMLWLFGTIFVGGEKINKLAKFCQKQVTSY